MNNIQKAFKNKAQLGLRMATGGVVPYGAMTNSDGSVDANSMFHPLSDTGLSGGDQSMLAARMNERQEQMSAGGQATNTFAGLRDQPTSVAPTSTPSREDQWYEETMARQNRLIDGYKGLRKGKVQGLKEGGIVHDFTGKGRPDKDTVPAMLAQGEAVLPEKTVVALGGPEEVKELIERTNGKPTVNTQMAKGLRGGVLHAVTGIPSVGDVIYPRELRPEFRSVAQTPVVEPAAKPGVENLRNANAERAMNKAAEAYRPAMNAGSANDALRAAGKIPVIEPVAAGATQASVQAAPSYTNQVAAAFKENPNVGDALKKGAKATYEGVKNSKVAGFTGRMGLKAAKLIPYLGAAADASDIVDVATDDNKTKLDVAEQTARVAGKWGSAAVGAKGGAALATPLAPLAGPFAPAVIAGSGLIGGMVGYFGADKLMDAGAGRASPASTSNGVTNKTAIALGWKDDPAAPTKTPAAQPVTLSDAQKTAAPQSDLQARSEHQSLIDFGQRQAKDRGMSNLSAIANDAGVRNTFNAAHEQSGTGIQYKTVVGADGKPQTLIAGNTPTKEQYIGADGKPTNDWRNTRDYADGVARANKDKALLAEMQRENLTRDAFDPSIRDPRVKALAQQQLAQMDQREAKMGEQGLRKQMLDQQGKYQNDHLQLLRDEAAGRREAGVQARKDKNLADADKMLEESGLEGRELDLFKSYMRINHYAGGKDINGNPISDKDSFEALSPEARRKMLPSAVANFKLGQKLNKYDLAGTTSLQAPVIKNVEKLGWKHASRDPNSLGVFSKNLFRGGNNKNDLTVADIAMRKIFPPEWHGGDEVINYEDGRTVLSPYSKGESGDLGSLDMRGLRQVQLDRKK